MYIALPTYDIGISYNFLPLFQIHWFIAELPVWVLAVHSAEYLITMVIVVVAIYTRQKSIALFPTMKAVQD